MQVSVSARMLANHVLSHEAGGSTDPNVLSEAIERVDVRLRERLAELIGLVGYTFLAARALHLAQAEIPTLVHVSVNLEGGDLRGIDAFVEAARDSINEPHAVEAGLVTILAHIIGLLSVFIGEDLALRLVREGWPDLGHNQIGLEG